MTYTSLTMAHATDKNSVDILIITQFPIVSGILNSNIKVYINI